MLLVGWGGGGGEIGSDGDTLLDAQSLSSYCSYSTTGYASAKLSKQILL